MIIAIQQPEHAPWLGFFDKMAMVDKYVLLDSTQFKKRYFENRNKIKTGNGWKWLTAPVISKGRYTQSIKSVEIDNSQDWRKKYTNSLKHAYARAPYYDRYAGAVNDIINSDIVKLTDLNIKLIELFRQSFGLSGVAMVRASEFGISEMITGSDLILEICRLCKADKYISGPDGVNYLNIEEYSKNGIEVLFHDYKHPSYSQLFGDFISHMSSFDFLFNCGGEAFNIQRRV